MPEGPVLILYREALQPLVGGTVTDAATTLRTVSLDGLAGASLTGICTWGKYLFFLFGENQHLRIHWGMFGQYRLDEERPGKIPTATFHFSTGTVLRLYAVSLRVQEGPPDAAQYDPSADVLHPDWDPKQALQKLRALPPGAVLCDALLDQSIFAGVGNAIKNESLWACRLRPEAAIVHTKTRTLENLIDETVAQSFLFLEERRHGGEGRYPWTRVFRRKTCPRCETVLCKGDTGVLQRISYWCPDCQPLSR